MKTINELQNQFLNNTFYKGIPTCKNPMDLWIYQEIIHEVKPDVIIEIGVWKGGSTMWLKDNSEAYVIGIDIGYKQIDYRAKEQTISWITGEATDEDVFKLVVKVIDKEKILVIEDSSHTYENTLKCLQLYSPLVSVGSYYIVEDTIAPELGYNLHPNLAVEDFLRDNDSFVVDKSREKYITWNKGGFLKRVK